MKTGKISQKSLTSSLSMAVGLAGGLAVSGSLSALAESMMPENLKDVSKVGIAGAGLAGGAYLNPNKDDLLGNALQGLSIAVAAKQGYDLARDAIAPQITVKQGEEVTALDTMLYGAVGLACPCNGQRALGEPEVVEFKDFSTEIPENEIVEIPNSAASLVGIMDEEENELARLV